MIILVSWISEYIVLCEKMPPLPFFFFLKKIYIIKEVVLVFFNFVLDG